MSVNAQIGTLPPRVGMSTARWPSWARSTDAMISRLTGSSSDVFAGSYPPLSTTRTAVRGARRAAAVVRVEDGEALGADVLEQPPIHLVQRWFFTMRMSIATVARCGMIVFASSPTNPLWRARGSSASGET